MQLKDQGLARCGGGGDDDIAASAELVDGQGLVIPEGIAGVNLRDRSIPDVLRYREVALVKGLQLAAFDGGAAQTFGLYAGDGVALNPVERGAATAVGAVVGGGVLWPYDRESATDFFTLASARYERNSIILTSNKGFGEWGELLEDSVIASGESGISAERLALLSSLVQVLEGSSGLPLDALESGVLPAAIAGEEDPDPGPFIPGDPRAPQSAVGAAFGPDYDASSAGDMALDLDGDGVADVSLVGLGGTSRPGTTWRDEEDQRRHAFRNARALAVMTMFRIGMTRQEYVEAIGTVARYELALIAHFREAVPDHTERWDAKRRFREIERRLARLRWVEMEQEKEYGGFRGLFNRARGRRRVTGKELYEKMVSDADDLVMAMAEMRPMDELSAVMQFSGLPATRRPPE